MQVPSNSKIIVQIMLTVFAFVLVVMYGLKFIKIGISTMLL